MEPSFTVRIVYSLSLILSATAWPNHSSRTIKYFSDLRPEGSYEYAYQTDNGIYAEESGSIRQHRPEPFLVVQGSYLYESPEGVPIRLTYTADENGFHPVGEHLPTPPPVPPQILRALAWIEKKKSERGQREDVKEGFFDNVKSQNNVL